MAVAELSPPDLRRYYDLARKRHQQWEDHSAWMSVGTFVAALFIPTLGPIPFGIAAIAMGWSIFRFGVWERERYAAARELFHNPLNPQNGDA